MRTASLVFAAGLAISGAASSQRAGTYSMQGIGLDGAPYAGSVRMRATGPQTWAITWFSDGPPIEGVGLSLSGGLAVGYTIDGEQGTAFYRVLPNGQLEGRWMAGADGRVGTETLVPK